MAPAVVALALACLAGPAAATRPPSIPGWGPVAAGFSGNTLTVWQGMKIRRPAFVYYRSTACRLSLAPGRRRCQQLVAITTSAGRFTGGQVIGGGDGSFVLVVRGRGFAPIVDWCCDAGGHEVVLESDGRPSAPQAVSASFASGKVSFLLSDPADGSSLVSVDPSGASRVERPFPHVVAPGQVDIAPGLIAWADQPAYAPNAVVRVSAVTDAGLARPRVLRQGGDVLGVWATPRFVAVLSRVGKRIELARYELPTTRRRVVWRGVRAPVAVAVGGRSLTLATAHAVFLSRPGRGLRRIATARRSVGALATDGRRVAILERVILGRGKHRGPRTAIVVKTT